MTTVKVTGWEPGLRKISLTKLLQQDAGKDLAGAKALVDGLLQGKTFEVTFEEEQLARQFAEKAKAIGAQIDRQIM
jgi:hypothetical protein